MRSLTWAHSRKRPALVTTSTSNFRGGRLRELRLYFLFLCTFLICLVPVFLLICWTIFSLWVVSLYSHCWLFLGSRGFCNNVFVVVVACVASVPNRVIARKLERKQKKDGFFVPLPLPRHSFFFFCSCPSFLDEPREETLATQASLPCYEHIRPGHLFLCAYCMFHSISGISSSLHFRVLS